MISGLVIKLIVYETCFSSNSFCNTFSRAYITKIMRKVFNLVALCAAMCVLFLLGRTKSADPTGESCEDCRFFPNVCYSIDRCITDCNIAPSMKQNCDEFIAAANEAGERNELLDEGL